MLAEPRREVVAIGAGSAVVGSPTGGLVFLKRSRDFIGAPMEDGHNSQRCADDGHVKRANFAHADGACVVMRRCVALDNAGNTTEWHSCLCGLLTPKKG